MKTSQQPQQSKSLSVPKRAIQHSLRLQTCIPLLPSEQISNGEQKRQRKTGEASSRCPSATTHLSSSPSANLPVVCFCSPKASLLGWTLRSSTHLLSIASLPNDASRGTADVEVSLLARSSSTFKLQLHFAPTVHAQDPAWKLQSSAGLGPGRNSSEAAELSEAAHGLWFFGVVDECPDVHLVLIFSLCECVDIYLGPAGSSVLVCGGVCGEVGV